MRPSLPPSPNGCRRGCRNMERRKESRVYRESGGGRGRGGRTRYRRRDAIRSIQGTGRLGSKPGHQPLSLSLSACLPAAATLLLLLLRNNLRAGRNPPRSLEFALVAVRARVQRPRPARNLDLERGGCGGGRPQPVPCIS